MWTDGPTAGHEEASRLLGQPYYKIFSLSSFVQPNVTLLAVHEAEYRVLRCT